MACLADNDNSKSFLLQCMNTNNIQELQSAWEKGTDVTQILHGVSLLEYACSTPERSRFIELCLKTQQFNVLQKNSSLSKYPIHFAVESLDAENIRALLSYKPEKQVNLRYQKRSPLFLLASKLDSSNYDKIFNCIQVLAEHGADFNMPDENGSTPIIQILMASTKKNVEDEKSSIIGLKSKPAKKCRKEIVEYCFKNAEIDVDTFRDGKARQLMQKHFPEVIIPDYRVTINFEVLQAFLDNGDCDRFEVGLPLLDNLDAKNCEDLLVSCITKGLDDCFKLIVEKSTDFKSVSISELLLKACRYGQFSILKELLSKIGEESESMINKEALLCESVRRIKSTESKVMCRFYECFKVLMSDKRVNVNQADENGCKALHYAINYKLNAVIEALLKASTYIGTKNKFNKLAIDEIDPDVFENYLNSCLTTNDERQGDDDYEIKINYACFLPPKSEDYTNNDEILPIVHISKSNELKHLLKHPVIWSYIFLKWSQLSFFFYSNLVICSIIFPSIVIYLTKYYGTSIKSGWGGLFWMIQLLGATYLLIREILQFFMSHRKYFMSLLNWMELVLIVLIYLVTFSQDFTESTKGILSAIIILLIGCEYIILVGSLPYLSISTHIAMLRTVSYNFLHSLLFYSIGLVSFALAFHFLFRTNGGKGSDDLDLSGVNKEENSEFNSFQNPFISMLKTFVMLTGEFEAAEIKVDINLVVCIVFALFVFFVPIVISNLINGLAVNDTQIIKSQAELVGLQQRVEVMEKYQQSVWLRGIKEKLFKIISEKPETNLPIEEIIIYPNKGNRFVTKLINSHGNNTDEEQNLMNDEVTQTECCLCNKCSIMETKVVKYANEILNERNQPDSNDKILSLERKIMQQDNKIDEILKILKSNAKK